MNDSELTLSQGKARLAAVLRMAGDVIRIDDAVRALNISRAQASKFLSRWTEQGWLRRVGRGAYVPVQLESLGSDQVVEDPWMLVPALFAPAYIGGRTATEHWDLTEQIFRDIVVFTARPVRKKTLERQSAIFTLKHIRKELIFGTKTVWRGQTKVAISDIHRTIIDMLDDPATGGGIQHVADCFGLYLKRRDRDFTTLIDYAERLGNGAVFKRLGFLASQHTQAVSLADSCRKRLTTGYTKLDTGLDCNRLVTHWRLWIPKNWDRKGIR